MMIEKDHDDDRRTRDARRAVAKAAADRLLNRTKYGTFRGARPAARHDVDRPSNACTIVDRSEKRSELEG